jgi:hypothetical protein
MNRKLTGGQAPIRKKRIRIITPFRVGLLAFLLSLFVMSGLVGPATCVDGWHSPSIGRPGACSWHGGVDRSSGDAVLIGSVFLGVVCAAATGYLSFKWENRGRPEVKTIYYRPPAANIGGAMRFSLVGLDEGGVRRSQQSNNLRLVCLIAGGGKLAIWGRVGSCENINKVRASRMPCEVECDCIAAEEPWATKYGHKYWVPQGGNLRLL